MPEGATVVVIAKSIASDADKATITEVPNEAAKVPPPVVVTAAVCSVTEEGIGVVLILAATLKVNSAVVVKSTLYEIS